MFLRGRARDLLTPADGSSPTVVAEDVVDATAAPDRTIETIRTGRTDLSGLIGARGGSRLRAALQEVVPDERRTGTPLYLILDDLAGATLVGGFAYTQWPDEWPTQWEGSRERAFKGRKMAGVCIGFGPGSSALTPEGDARPVDNTRAVAPLPHPDDPIGWHEFRNGAGVTMRRARRVDVWFDGEQVEIDAMFQDSASTPGGGRVAVHEYQVQARATADTFQLVSINAVPRVLPFSECPNAVTGVGRLVGTPVAALRDEVLARLRTTQGCTHLNDEVRALAEVPVLAQHLRASQ
jgi:hypothetical protein